MALVDFTTFDDIRAVLGVSVDEIEDATLSLAVYEYNLMVELEEIDESLASDFATAAQKSKATRTANEEKFVQATALFSTYAVARQLTAALPLFSPKEISDGKASMTRYAQNPYLDTIKAVEKGYERYRARLVTVYGTLNSTEVSSTPLPYMSVASPSIDPVTGE